MKKIFSENIIKTIILLVNAVLFGNISYRVSIFVVHNSTSIELCYLWQSEDYRFLFASIFVPIINIMAILLLNLRHKGRYLPFFLILLMSCLFLNFYLTYCTITSYSWTWDSWTLDSWRVLLFAIPSIGYLGYRTIKEVNEYCNWDFNSWKSDIRYTIKVILLALLAVEIIIAVFIAFGITP